MNARLSVVLCALGLLVLAGCLSPVRQKTDALVCNRAHLPIDPLPSVLGPPEELPAPKGKEPTEAGAAALLVQQAGAILPQQPQQLDGKEMPLFLKRLQLPANVPGSEAPSLKLPDGWKKMPDAEKDKYLARYFPKMLPMGPEPTPELGPEGRPLTLADLQRLARENSPLLREAAFQVAQAEGAAQEAGMYPNPSLTLTNTQISFTSGPTIMPGISQTIKTMGKLKLGQNMALMDLANARLAYRRAETDLMASVRSNYYAVLVQLASIKANRALADLTDEVYNVMLQQLKGGQVATYEPLQISVFAAQARAALVTSRTQYLSSWKQLAAALGLPAMPPTAVAGGVDQSFPRFDYQKCLAQILVRHTDALTAENGIRKMRYNLRLNEVTPVPDVTLGVGVLYDASPPGPPRWMAVTTGSMTLPVWDLNQGGIKQAQGMLGQAIEEPHRVRAALTASVSDAFNRLETNRILLEMYIKQMLPQQANAFRATVLRHYIGEVGGVAFNDLIAAEQNLVSLIPMYLTTLAAYWQAVSDIASLLQTDNVYEMATEVENCPLPDLTQLLQLPNCHPCSSLPNPALKGISAFESPPGRPFSPEVLGVEKVASPASNTPAAPKQTSAMPATGVNTPAALPALPGATPPAAPALLLPPIGGAAASNPRQNAAVLNGFVGAPSATSATAPR